MKRVVLVTQHYYGSVRRGGFHWLADAWERLGWDVVFATVYLSRLTQLRGQDHRLAHPVLAEGNRPRRVRDHFTSFVWLTGWHPMNLRVGWLNRATVPLFRLYGRLPLRGLERLVVPADLLVCESHAGLLLFERFAQLAPAARTVYRVSDSLDLLDVHPCIQQAEQRFAPRFDRVSSPCEYLHRRFDGLPQSHMDFHGVAAEAFEAADSSPYPDDSRPRAVYVGTAHVDTDFLARAARLCPEVEFHVIGPITGLAEGTNLVAHGSMSFARTAAFVRHADVALACRTHGPGAESLTDSLKIRQYAYCRLPIVLPEFLADGRTNRVAYRPGDDASIRAAMEKALAMGRAAPERPVQTWEQLARTLAGPLA